MPSRVATSSARNVAANVLFVVDHLDTGGAPVVVRDLILGMQQAGVAVTLVILSDRQRYTFMADVDVVQLPFKAEGTHERWQRYALHARRLDQWLEQQGMHFDLVLAHLHHAHQVVSRTRLAGDAWYCLHADPVTGFLGNKRGVGRWLKQRKVKSLYDGRKVVTVSRGMLERLCFYFGIRPQPGVAIHNPLDIDRIRELGQAPVDDVPVEYLLYVGRMDVRQKRFDRLFDAYQASGVSLPLILVGGGSGQAAVEAMVVERGLTGQVQFLGHRDNPYAYMQRATAQLLSSDYEGFALVLAEALTLGTPVVSVDCPSGPAEILQDFPEYLVPLNDTQAFARVIRRVTEQPPAIPRDICDRFRIERVVERYLELANPANG